MKCAKCGHEFFEGIFCPECGTKYEEVVLDEKTVAEAAEKEREIAKDAAREEAKRIIEAEEAAIREKAEKEEREKAIKIAQEEAKKSISSEDEDIKNEASKRIREEAIQKAKEEEEKRQQEEIDKKVKKEKGVDRKAILSLSLGIATWVLLFSVFLTIITPITSICSIVIGIISLKNKTRRKKPAIIGILLSAIYWVMIIVIAIFFGFYENESNQTSNDSPVAIEADLESEKVTAIDTDNNNMNIEGNIDENSVKEDPITEAEESDVINDSSAKTFINQTEYLKSLYPDAEVIPAITEYPMTVEEVKAFEKEYNVEQTKEYFSNQYNLEEAAEIRSEIDGVMYLHPDTRNQIRYGLNEYYGYQQSENAKRIIYGEYKSGKNTVIISRDEENGIDRFYAYSKKTKLEVDEEMLYTGAVLWGDSNPRIIEIYVGNVADRHNGWINYYVTFLANNTIYVHVLRDFMNNTLIGTELEGIYELEKKYDVVIEEYIDESYDIDQSEASTETYELGDSWFEDGDLYNVDDQSISLTFKAINNSRGPAAEVYILENGWYHQYLLYMEDERHGYLTYTEGGASIGSLSFTMDGVVVDCGIPEIDGTYWY